MERKRKVIGLTLVFAILLSMFSIAIPSFYAAGESGGELGEGTLIGIIGDADQDGKITVKDATRVQKHVAKMAKYLLSETAQKLVNFLPSGKIDVNCATWIQKYVAKFNLTGKAGEKIGQKLYEGGSTSDTSNPTDPSGTTPTNPTGTNSTDPSDTTPTNPTGTNPTDPSDTNPTDPSGTNPTDPSDTNPTDPSDTNPTDPTDTDPTDPTDTNPTDPEEVTVAVHTEIFIPDPTDTEDATVTHTVSIEDAEANPVEWGDVKWSVKADDPAIEEFVEIDEESGLLTISNKISPFATFKVIASDGTNCEIWEYEVVLPLLDPSDLLLLSPSVFFTDEGFWNYLFYDYYNLADYITKAEAEAVVEFDTKDAGVEIASLVDLAYFPNLEKLILADSFDSDVLSMDFSSAPKLTYLDIKTNTHLQTIDVSSNTELTTLICDGTALTGLDLSTNTKLESLSLMSDKITMTELDISKTLVTCDKLSIDDSPIRKIIINGSAQNKDDFENAFPVGDYPGMVIEVAV